MVSAASRFPGHPDRLADLVAGTTFDMLHATGYRPRPEPREPIEAVASWGLIVVGDAVVGSLGPTRDFLDATFWALYVTPMRELLRQTGHGGSLLTVDPDTIDIRFSSNVECFDAGGAFGEPGPEEPELV